MASQGDCSGLGWGCQRRPEHQTYVSMPRPHLHSASLALLWSLSRFGRRATRCAPFDARSTHFALQRPYVQEASSTAHQENRSGMRAVGNRVVRPISVGCGARRALLSAQYTLLGPRREEVALSVRLVLRGACRGHDVTPATTTVGRLPWRSSSSTSTLADRIKPAPSRAVTLSVRPTAR